MNYWNRLLEGFMTHFELILTIAVVVCLLFYIIDAFTFAGERKRLLKRLKSGEADATDRQDYFMRLDQAERSGIKKKHLSWLANTREALEQGVTLSGNQLHWVKKPVYPLEKFIEFFSGMFWILCIIWFVRSFLYEPFRIPSGSMEPTLYAGDFILTSKYTYGVRLPVLRTKIIETGKVERGDVLVFRYPVNPALHYIKRVVAVPGDRMRVASGRLWINGAEQPLEFVEKMGDFDVFLERLGGRSHQVQFASDERLRVQLSGEVVIPEGQYFVMGDNRDNSQDSRFWGLVADEHVVGKALFIWMNSDCVLAKGGCSRIGDGIR